MRLFIGLVVGITYSLICIALIYSKLFHKDEDIQNNNKDKEIY
jgi:hypothetical protein